MGIRDWLLEISGWGLVNGEWGVVIGDWGLGESLLTQRAQRSGGLGLVPAVAGRAYARIGD